MQYFIVLEIFLCEQNFHFLLTFKSKKLWGTHTNTLNIYLKSIHNNQSEFLLLSIYILKLMCIFFLLHLSPYSINNIKN